MEDSTVLLDEISTSSYDMYFLLLGRRLHECISWISVDEEAGFVDEPIKSLRRIILEHNKTFPVHPLCIRRVYWGLTLNKKENGIIKFELKEFDASVCRIGARGSFDYQDLIEEKPLNINFSSPTDSLPLDIARSGLLTKEDIKDGEVLKLYVQEHFQILREGDWNFVNRVVYHAEEYTERDGLSYLETVFPVARWINGSRDDKPTIFNYCPIPRYSNY